MIQSAEEFIRLRTSDCREDYILAANEEAPISVWFDLVERFQEMMELVSLNKTVPLEILELLAKDVSGVVRAAVADRRRLSSELFDMLSRDLDEVVRQRVAYNKKAPTEVLRRLSMDESRLVRVAAEKMLALRDR